MKTIEINHPTADEILELKELQEALFRVGEHIEEYWERRDKMPDGHKIGDYGNLAYQCSEIINNIYQTAWAVRHLISDFGELPF